MSAIGAMKKFFVFFTVVSFSFLTACGGGSSSTTTGGGGGGGGGGFTPQGNFSVASLSGQYTYQLTGTAITSGFPAFAESGVFTADGKGNLTAGTDDVVPGSPVTSSFTGTYSVANDGTGFLNLQFSGATAQLAITMINSSKLYLSETDGSANGSGTAELQTASALSSAPSGTFAFRIHNGGTLQKTIAQVGAFTVSSGSVTGNEDELATGGSASALTFTGSFNAPISAGRGTGTFTDSNNHTLSFQYYIVNANTVNIMPVALDAVSIFGAGRAELQTGGPFSNSSLSTGFAFGSRGDTANLDGSFTTGRFTGGGDGTISAGAEDFVVDGISGVNDAFTGTYTMTSNGRAAVSLTSSSFGTVPEIFWMVSPTRGFFLVNGSTKVEDGTMDAQSSTSFSNSSLTGQSAISMGGFNSTVFADRIGTLTWNAGSVAGNFVEVDTGSASNGVLTTTYSVTANGRTTMTFSGFPSSATSDFVFYQSSAGNGYLLQNDGNNEIGGTISLQSQ